LTSATSPLIFALILIGLPIIIPVYLYKWGINRHIHQW
jgi:hypothetical protein